MAQSDWNNRFPLQLGSEPGVNASLWLARPGDVRRPVFESFVQQRFDEAHGARISSFMPDLLGLHDDRHQLGAVCGARLAAGQPLFLEQYLAEPVERAIACLAGRPVAREEIVEVGNLAASSSGSARLIIVLMTCLLAQRGLRWVVFTGATGLINSFHRLGLEPLHLCSADQALLGEQSGDWGRYYQQRPQVFAGSIQLGYQQLCERGVPQRLGLLAACAEAPHAA
jgi:hypothetical protein